MGHTVGKFIYSEKPTKIRRNFHADLSFSKKLIKWEILSKFCGLLRIYELYLFLKMLWHCYNCEIYSIFKRVYIFVNLPIGCPFQRGICWNWQSFRRKLRSFLLTNNLCTYTLLKFGFSMKETNFDLIFNSDLTFIYYF